MSLADTKWTIKPNANRNPPDLITTGSNYAGTGIRSSGSTGINGMPIDKGTMQDCLRTLGTGDFTAFGQWTCGALTWELGSDGWANPSDCHQACVNGLSAAINDGANHAYCDAYAGPTNAVHCWEGFHM